MNLETHCATARCIIINILFQSYFNQAPEFKTQHNIYRINSVADDNYYNQDTEINNILEKN